MRNLIRALIERKDWERQRAEGKRMFVLKVGFWSLIASVVFTLIDYLFDGRIIVETIWFSLVLGLALGLFMWREGEKKYQKHLREQSEKNNWTILPPMTRL